MTTSPDLRAYVDLTLDDRTPQEIFDAALAAAAVKLPGWVPAEGNTEVVLLEALALQVHEIVAAVNRMPGAVVQALMKLYGIDPDLGTAANVDVIFTVSDIAGHAIPAGTRLKLPIGSGDPIDLTTDAELVIAAGQNTGTVTASAVEAGTRGNGTPAGEPVDVVDAIFFVESAVTATDVSGGTDPETSDEWIDRATQVTRRLTEALVLPDHFTARALEDPAVHRATTVNNFDPDAGSGIPGDHLGHVTVAVLAEDGVLLSDAFKDALQTTLADAALANLRVHVIDPTITDVDVDVTVRRFDSATDADVQATVAAALAAYLDPDTWPWGDTVARNELIPTIDAADGVDLVIGLTTPAADVQLPGAAPLAALGNVVVTVQAP